MTYFGYISQTPNHAQPSLDCLFVRTCLHVLAQLLLLLVSSIRSVLEELLDKVDVGHDHTAAAVSLKTELVHSVAIGLAFVRDQLKVALPEVTSDLSTGEATDGDNHFDSIS
jgi:hypothetical protein